MKKYVCKECGKTFENKRERQFCSWDCYKSYIIKHPNKKENKKVQVICKECGKIEYVAPSRAKKYVCCSVKCLSRYNAERYSQKVILKCPICGNEYESMRSKVIHHRTCGNPICRHEWLSKVRKGKGNSRYINIESGLTKYIVTEEKHEQSRYIYMHIAKSYLGLNSICDIPKGYVIHHKDANHENNDPENLVVLPKGTHRKIHTIFGNILINALHTGKMDRETFFGLCKPEQALFYKEIIDLSIKDQAVVKQGELLESPEEENQQPSIYRNIYEGSTTNERVLTDNAEDSNFDTSALL